MGSMGATKIACNRQDKLKLAPYAGSVTTLAGFFQTNTEEFLIRVVDPNVSSPIGQIFTVLDCSDSELRLVIYSFATGNEGDEAEHILAASYEAAFTWDADQNGFVGKLNLHTEEVAAYIDQAESRAAKIEINLITDGVPTTVYQGSVTLLANADIGGSTAPSVLTETGGLARVTLVAGDDVSFTDNVVTISGLGLGSAPSYFLILGVEAPDGYGPITANFVQGSGSSDGFSVVLSAVPEVDTYKLVYLPVA